MESVWRLFKCRGAVQWLMRMRSVKLGTNGECYCAGMYEPRLARE
jgi:hypothetical protein